MLLKLFKIFLMLTCSIVNASAERCMFFTLLPENKSQLDFIKSLTPETCNCKIMGPMKLGEGSKLMMHNGTSIDFINQLRNIKMNFKVTFNRSNEEHVSFNDLEYHSVNGINKCLENITTHNPFATTFHLAHTVENRTVMGIKFSFDTANENRSIVVGSNVEAHDFITVKIAEALIQTLNNCTQEERPSDICNALVNFDWYIIPTINPDGYEYARTIDHTWCKNRCPLNEECNGVYLMNNWPWSWTNSSACNGPEPLSEFETQGLIKLFNTLSYKKFAYMGFNGFGREKKITLHQPATIPEQLIARWLSNKVKRKYGAEYKIVYLNATHQNPEDPYTMKYSMAFYLNSTNKTEDYTLPANRRAELIEEALFMISVFLNDYILFENYHA